MDRAYYLYEAMNQFRKSQIANRETYLEKRKKLEKYRGSVGFENDLQKIRDERDKANASARAECAAKIGPIFEAMHEANAKRRVTPPTEEAMRLLSAVKMLKKPSKEFLDSVANSLNGEAFSLAILDDIAREAWSDEVEPRNRLVTNYSSTATNELTVSEVARAIDGLHKTCNAIIDSSGANLVRTMTAEMRKIRYGAHFDPDDLPQEPEYSDEKDFYDREIKKIHLSESDKKVYRDLFIEAVNA